MGRLLLHGLALAACAVAGIAAASAAGLDPVAGTLGAALLYLLARAAGRRLTDALGRRRVAAAAGLGPADRARLLSAMEMLDRGHPDVARATLASLSGRGALPGPALLVWARACLRLVTHRGFGLGSAEAWAGVTEGLRRPLPRLERALLAPGLPADGGALAAECAVADDTSLAAILGVRGLLLRALLPAVGRPHHLQFPRAEQDLERLLGRRFLLLPGPRLAARADALQSRRLLPPREEAALLLLGQGCEEGTAALLASGDAAGTLSRRGRALLTAARILLFLRDGGSLAVSPEVFRRRTREIFLLHTRPFAMTDGSPHLEALADGPRRLLDLLREKRRLVGTLALLAVRRPGLSRTLLGVARRIAAGAEGVPVPRSPRRFLRWWRREGRFRDDAVALNLRGLLLLREGRAAESTGEFEAALRLDPGLAAAVYNLAAALEESGLGGGDPAAPLRRFAERERDPSGPLPGLLLGEFLERTGSVEEAEGVYRRLLEEAPMDADGNLALGRLLLESGRAEEAEESFRRVLGARSGDADALVSLALVQLEKGRPAEAVPLLRSAMEAGDGDRREEARFFLHVAFRDAEDHDRALETLDAVPDRFLRHNEPMLEDAALYLEERSRFDRARRLQERLRQLRARRGEL